MTTLSLCRKVHDGLYEFGRMRGVGGNFVSAFFRAVGNELKSWWHVRVYREVYLKWKWRNGSRSRGTCSGGVMTFEPWSEK